MKIEINNLTALIQGRDLNLYQRSLAVGEWHKLLNHVKEIEQALSIADIMAILPSSETIEENGLGLFGVSGRFYSDKEIQKIKYLSFLQGTVDSDTGEE